MDSKDPDVYQPINLGNPYEFSMLDLASRVLELTGSKSQLVFEDLPSDDPKQRKPDISLANKMLGWTPNIQLDEGLISTINYFRGKV
jgi:UDP-glucuronate decarboxylase